MPEFNMIDKTYIDNKVFKRMTECSEFYYLLSFSVFGFLTPGVMVSMNIDSYIFSSMQGTVDSMHEILLKGRVNDAYALLRKYHDSIIINIYTILYAKDSLEKENFLVTRINNWVKGKEQLPEYRIMSNYIRDQKDVSPINELLYGDDTYTKLRDRCNDNAHYNFYHNVLLNDKDIYNENRISELNKFSQDLDNLFILHISYLFYINNHYMTSSDYADSMDMGIEPKEGCQYNVAPFIQKLFDEVLNKQRPDIAKLIKDSTSMRLE